MYIYQFWYECSKCTDLWLVDIFVFCVSGFKICSRFVTLASCWRKSVWKRRSRSLRKIPIHACGECRHFLLIASCMSLYDLGYVWYIWMISYNVCDVATGVCWPKRRLRRLTWRSPNTLSYAARTTRASSSWRVLDIYRCVNILSTSTSACSLQLRQCAFYSLYHKVVQNWFFNVNQCVIFDVML